MTSRIERFFADWRTSWRAQVIAGIVGACLLLTVAFSAGVMLGARNAPTSWRALPASPLEPAPDQIERISPRGTFGSITGIDKGMITVMDRRTGRPMQIHIGDRTVIERGRQRRIPFQELRVGEPVFVVGAPRSNTIDAEFIGVIHQQPINLRIPPRFAAPNSGG